MEQVLNSSLFQTKKKAKSSKIRRKKPVFAANSNKVNSFQHCLFYYQIVSSLERSN